MAVIGFAGIGIAGGFRPLDFITQGGGPFRCGKYAAFLQRARQRKGLRFPGFAKYRFAAVVIAGECAQRMGSAIGNHGPITGSKYGSKASIDTLSVGSVVSPHNSRPSNTTV